MEISGCEELADTDDSLPLEEVINNFELTDGLWGEIASAVINTVPRGNQMYVLLGTRDAVCTPEATIKDDDCNQLAVYESSSGIVFADVKTGYSSQGTVWRSLLEVIDETSMSDEQKHDSIILVKDALCHD